MGLTKNPTKKKNKTQEHKDKWACFVEKTVTWLQRTILKSFRLQIIFNLYIVSGIYRSILTNVRFKEEN